MRIGIVVGSHRQESESGRVGRYLQTQLQGLGAETWLKDLGQDPLPLWDEGVFGGTARADWSFLPALSAELKATDAFILIAPEWHGMVPSGLKNFLMMWGGNGELAHKPALLVTLSSVDGGATPIAELRMSGYKNNRICYMPEQLVIRNVGTVFHTDDSKNNPEAHQYFVDRAAYCLELLVEYARAFGAIRSSGKASLEQYPNGM
jgi:NAD(P)H-dependent FMN reductase